MICCLTTKMLRLRVWGFVWVICYGLAVSQIIDPLEAKALVAIKSRLIDTTVQLGNWNRGDPCSSNWTGVLCFDTIGTDGYLHVRELQLLNRNLSGNLSPALGQLSQLRTLDFMWNKLTGSIPKEIGNILPLRLLLLNGNELSGALPDELGNLANLKRLQIDSNSISGPVPSSFANLKNVRHLHLNNNSISGPIPAELSELPALLHLLLDNNNLSGYLPPELSNLPELSILQLDNNNFNGSEIPSTYGNISTLVKLSLRNCSLQGVIPDFIMSPKLIYLDLSWNKLTGPIPSSRHSDNITTINLSHNRLNGSIPTSFSYNNFLQKLSLEDNILTGSVSTHIWNNITFSEKSRLQIDLRNNSLSNIIGELNPPENVTLRLEGNPVCKNANIEHVAQFCGSVSEGDRNEEITTIRIVTCPTQACPAGGFFEYVPASPVPCYCAAPIRIGYRLKSPSFSYFLPYQSSFEMYLTSSLNLELYQLSIDSFMWEAGPRLGMYLKIFPVFDPSHSGVFNLTELQRIRGILTSWNLPKTDFFGPYELLNFTLLGPYSDILFESQSRRISAGIWVAIIAGAIACAVTVTAIITVLVTRRHARHKHILARKRLTSKVSMQMEGVKEFTYKEMVVATENFNCSSQLGRGGYGIVYRGTLPDNTAVAIKRAEEGSLQGQKEFLTEIKLLSRLHHRNLVSLIGYCDDEVGEQMLVYEFMPNGTLRDQLSAKAKGNLSFCMRLRIALGSAKGILYLHTEAQPPVFHRDIKASNILLDSNFNAKVADFGLSLLAPVADADGSVPNYISTVVKGTPGYLDPEYFLTHKLTDKSDVYSLGVVFLELLTGMHPISHGKNIVRETKMANESGTMFSIIDNRMGSYPSQCIEKFITLALSCCHDKPEQRPSMLDVVRELENILKMMPEIDVMFSEDVSSSYSGKSASSSKPSSYVTRELFMSSSDIVGSNLMSGVTVTIMPR